MTDLDIVVLTDLRFPGGTSSSLAEELVASLDAGYHIGLLHLQSPRLGAGSVVHYRLAELLEHPRLRQLLPGEPVSCSLAMVKHPTVFVEPLGGPLPISADHVIVVTGQVPSDAAGTYYDATAVEANIIEALGIAPTWHPVSPLVRESLSGVAIAADDWSEIIDPAMWTTDRSGDDVGADTRPRLVIGRHSRPDRLKWPDDAADLAAAYPVDGSVDVRVLGGADAVADVLGEVPAAWNVIPFGQQAPAEFLAGLDAFVYFHHPDLAEAFGRTILEALAAGVVVVTAPHFRATFGEACLYSEPDGAISAIETLLADPAAHVDHLERARRVVQERFSHGAHRARVARIIGPPKQVDAESTPKAPSLDLVPPGLRRSYTTVMVTCLGADLDSVEATVRLLDRERRRAPGFIPIVVHATAKSPLAAELGVATAVIMSRSRFAQDGTGSWEDYAQRRIRQLAAHHGAANVMPADLTNSDAWITLHTHTGTR